MGPRRRAVYHGAVRSAVAVPSLLACLALAGAAHAQPETAAHLSQPPPGASSGPGPEEARPEETRIADGALACWHPNDFALGRAPPSSEEHRCRRDVVEIVELYAWASVFGLGAGGWLGARLEVDEGLDALFAGVGAAGAGVGVWALDRALGGMLPGVPTTLSTGVLLGAFEGVLAWSAFGNEPFTGKWSGTFYLSATALGVLVAGVVGAGLAPSTGDNGVVRSGAIWGTWLAWMLNLVFDVADDQVDTFRLLFTGYNAGIVGAAILSSVVRMTRVRMLWIDLGALAGAFAAAVLVQPNDSSDRAVGALVGLGTLAGMALSVWLTEPDDAEPDGGSSEQAARFTPWGGAVPGGAVVGTTTRF